MQQFSRRTVCLLSGSVLTWLALRGRDGFTALAGPAAAPQDGTALLHRPVKVPIDFVGMHAHRWPAEAGSSAAPTYRFGTARSHDHNGVQWSDIHPGPDRYAWNALDSWVHAHRSANRTLIYTLYGTPAWLCGDTGRRDLYGKVGGAAPPQDLGELCKFICALLNRYNGDGERRISFVETWNEPHFEGQSRDFWWGSAEQMISVGRTLWEVSRRATGSRVLSPGFVSDAAPSGWASWHGETMHRSMSQYLRTADGHGVTGAACCDGVAFHTYNVALAGSGTAGLHEVQEIRHLLDKLNLPLPIYNTECGFVSPHPFHELPTVKQALFLKRLGVLQAAQGVQSLCFYAHDDECIGNPSEHAEIAGAIDALQAKVAGATLKQVVLRSDGQVRVETDGEAFLW